jgi:Dynamin family
VNHLDFEALLTDVLRLFDEIDDATPTPALHLMLEDGRRELSCPCYVVVCGEFSRGKSNLLNALVERPGLFPAHLAVSTSIVTELRWGETETAEVYHGGGVARRIPIDRVTEYVTEQDNPANAKDVHLVRLTAPLALLGHHLVLIDTPGIGSLNIDHATATYAALGQADAVLFVGAADERMSTAELSYLASAMHRCPVVITVLTKIDNIFEPGPRNEVEVARERIGNISGRPTERIDIVGVSARRKLIALANGDSRGLRESGFPELEGLLWKRLTATWGAAHLERALSTLDDVITTLSAPLINEGIARSSDDALETIRAGLDEARARARELGAESATWRRGVADLLQAAAPGIRGTLDEKSASVRDAFFANAHSPRVLDDPAALIRQTAAELVDAAEAASAALRDAAAAAARQTRLTLTVSVEDFRDLVPKLDVPPALLARYHGTGIAGSVFRAAAAGAGVGAGIGAGVGNLILPGPGGAVGTVIGGLVGQVVGLLTGVRDYVERTRSERRTERSRLLTDVVLPQLERIIARIGEDVDDAVTVTRDRLLAEFDTCIYATMETLNESIASLEQLRASTEQERLQRGEELEARLDRLDKFADRRAILAARTHGLLRE